MAEQEGIPATPGSAAQVAEAYRDRAARLGTTLAEIRRRGGVISVLRLMTFFLVLAALIWLVAVSRRS
ncbi:MAG TPA: hypothetical protein VN677_00045, partial [Gemmatimonadaceae bacterium]|nr:hypothetical protein [Gemmatimonadaceae bacterium]